MSFAQEQRRQPHIEKAKDDLDSKLVPYRAQQMKLREQIAQSNPPSAELQQQLDKLNEEISQIVEASFWWQLYQKD